MRPIVIIGRAALLVILFTGLAGASLHQYGRDLTVIGSAKTHVVKENESLIEIARQHGLGFTEIADSNPSLDAFVPGTGKVVKISTMWVLPDSVPQDGIVINLSEMRLYYFMRNKTSGVVRTFPIGIGREGFESPIGRFTIINKTVGPSWHVPKSIREEKPELPAVVPPGPDNPLGSHALRLSIGDVLIHGTNKPWGVGRRVSHGCIRLYPEHIPELFATVPVGAKVAIIRQPVKVGVRDRKVYVEVHSDEDWKGDYFDEAMQGLRKKDLLKQVNTKKLYRALIEKRGVPVDVTE
jgi:L,D-transpeptidase ErfK/SrfK